jgi:predicted Zn-ribbon and HTH transcriptional regulator
METVEKIFSVIQKAGAPVSVGQIVELSGIDRKEVDKAMKKLKTSGRISSPKNCYWEPAK